MEYVICLSLPFYVYIWLSRFFPLFSTPLSVFVPGCEKRYYFPSQFDVTFDGTDLKLVELFDTLYKLECF